MILSYTQTQVAHDPKTWHWLQSLQPDQTVQLISTADDRYRIDDDCCRDGETDSMTTDRLSRVTAGSKRHANFVKQLKRNNIIRMSNFRLKIHQMDGTFTDTALKATTSKLSQETRDKIVESLTFIGNRCDTGAYNGNEHQFQKMMDPLLIDMIDSEAYATVQDGWKDFEATNPGTWNRGSKVLEERYQDLSQPKVDFSLALSMQQDQSEGLTEQSTPLSRICQRVQSRSYRCRNMEGRGEDVSFERAIQLLSVPALRRFNAHDRLKRVCFVHKTRIRNFGNYPISVFEFKSTKEFMAVCENQIVNSCVFQCGKLIDLLFEAQSLQEDADLPERVLSLGMCIAGKEWKVIAISSTENDELGGGFVYGEICNGNWHVNPEKFIGAVIAMHEHNENRTVRLLLKCFGIFDDWVAEQPSQQDDPNIAWDLLSERGVPQTKKLETVEEGSDGEPDQQHQVV